MDSMRGYQAQVLHKLRQFPETPGPLKKEAVPVSGPQDRFEGSSENLNKKYPWQSPQDPKAVHEEPVVRKSAFAKGEKANEQDALDAARILINAGIELHKIQDEKSIGFEHASNLLIGKGFSEAAATSVMRYLALGEELV